MTWTDNLEPGQRAALAEGLTALAGLERAALARMSGLDKPDADDLDRHPSDMELWLYRAYHVYAEESGGHLFRLPPFDWVSAFADGLSPHEVLMRATEVAARDILDPLAVPDELARRRRRRDVGPRDF